MRTHRAVVLLAFFAAQASAAKVHVTVHVPQDTPVDAPVYLAGSTAAVGQWRADGVKLARQPDGTYTGDVDVATDETFEYKFDRGSWTTVEQRADGSDQPNRVFTAASGATIDATVARWNAGPPPSSVVGTLRLQTIDSHFLGRVCTLRVWLPPGYDADAQQRYPVLYLHDGQNCFDRSTAAYGQEWQVDETLTKLIDGKTIPPIIAVGIDNGGAVRIDDMTFDADPVHHGGHAEPYARFVLEEVMPLVDKTYRTQTGPAHTFLCGSSLGGLVTLEIARRHPGTFGGIIAMSPSLWWDHEALTARIEKDAGGLAAARVWLDIGTAEEPGDAAATNVAQTRRLDAALTAAHIEHELTVDAGAHHNETAWAKRFPAAITYVLAAPK